jgi:hypothetical protein
MKEMGVLQMGLQLHVLVVMTICNSSYKYNISCIKKIALISMMQLIVYGHYTYGDKNTCNLMQLLCN